MITKEAIKQYIHQKADYASDEDIESVIRDYDFAYRFYIPTRDNETRRGGGLYLVYKESEGEVYMASSGDLPLVRKFLDESKNLEEFQQAVHQREQVLVDRYKDIEDATKRPNVYLLMKINEFVDTN